MKILNLSIEIIGQNTKTKSPYLSQRMDFATTLAKLTDIA